MAGEIKFLRFSDGTTVSAPSSLTIDIAGLTSYANDAAFETAKGSGGAAGDIYFNTTDNEIKFHNGSAWATVIDSVEIANYPSNTRNINTNANSGLAGGGDLSADRSLSLDASNLVAESTLDGANDYIPFYDDSAAGMRKVLVGNVGGSGGGSGTGAVNYITNPDFETDTSDWSTYDDGAVAIPVDGTGGSPTALTISRETTSVLRGTGSLKLAKSAADGQGEGTSINMTIDSADQNRLMRLSFELDGSDANYAAGDLVCYLISDTGGTPTVITPSVTQLPSGKFKYEALVVTDDQPDWRLCLHIATTNASAWNVYVDDVLFTPELTVTANPMTGWASYVPDITSTGTNPTKGTIDTDIAYYRRVGDEMQIRYFFRQTAAGTAGTGDYLISLPDNLTIDSSRCVVGASNGRAGSLGSAMVGNDVGYVGARTTTALSIHLDPASIDQWGQPLYPLSTAVLSATFSIQVPIAEWAGSVVTAANSRVEYAYNNQATLNVDDTTSFAYGPTGISIQAHTADTQRRVRFQTPILETDTIIVQIRHAGSNTGWQNVGNSYMGFNRNGATNSGIWVNNVNDTDVDVFFGADGAYSGRAWSTETATEWRAVKCSNPLGIGTGLATATQAGAVKALNKWEKHALTSSITSSTTDITDLKFNNLTIGNIYRVSAQILGVIDTPFTATEIVRVEIFHNAAEIAQVGIRADNVTDKVEQMAHTSVIFKAVATTVTFDVDILGTGNSLQLTETFAILEELNNYDDETTDFT